MRDSRGAGPIGPTLPWLKSSRQHPLHPAREMELPTDFLGKKPVLLVGPGHTLHASGIWDTRERLD